MNILGQIFNHNDAQNAHKWIPLGWCSYGKETPWENLWYWIELTFGSVENAYIGAPIGQRPLYYHIYKDDTYYYVQYWYWFNANDIRYQTNNQTWHEGDWEHFSIRLVNTGNPENINDYIPNKIALYQHHGGHTKSPNVGLWSDSHLSVSNRVTGYDTNHTHPIIFLAANSHASYFHGDARYQIQVDAPGQGFDELYNDAVDFNLTSGVQLFVYDFLDKLGECSIGYDVTFHNTLYYKHTMPTANDAGKEWLGWPGRCGKGWDFSPTGLTDGYLTYISAAFLYNVESIPAVGPLMDWILPWEIPDVQGDVQTPAPFTPFFNMHYYYFPEAASFGNESTGTITITWFQ